MRKFTYLGVFFLLLFLAGCRMQTPGVMYNGRELSSEELAEMRESFVTEREESTETETDKESCTETDADGTAALGTEGDTETEADGVVYWTEGGVVWHESETCHRISKKNPTITGSIKDAMAAKKQEPCSFCCPEQ